MPRRESWLVEMRVRGRLLGASWLWCQQSLVLHDRCGAESSDGFKQFFSRGNTVVWSGYIWANGVSKDYISNVKHSSATFRCIPLHLLHPVASATSSWQPTFSYTYSNTSNDFSNLVCQVGVVDITWADYTDYLTLVAMTCTVIPSWWHC